MGASGVHKDVRRAPVVVGGEAGGAMMVAVPALNGGAEVVRSCRLCRRRAPVFRLASVKVLCRLVLQPQF